MPAATDVEFALAVFGFVAWVAALTLLLPRLLAFGVAFALNRMLARKAHLSIGALYLYPLAGRFVAHRIVLTDPDAAVSISEVIAVWRWWRRGRLLTSFDDDGASAAERSSRGSCWRWFCFWRPFVARVGDCLASDAPPADEGPAALLSFTCSGLRVRLINMKANYDLLARLRSYAESPEGGDHPRAPAPLDASEQQKTMVDHLLEYSSLKVISGALYVYDPANSPLARILFKTARVRYKHGHARSKLDLYRFTLSGRITELRIGVGGKDMLDRLGIHDPLCTAPMYTSEPNDPTRRARWRDSASCAGCLGGAEPSSEPNEPGCCPGGWSLASCAGCFPSSDCATCFGCLGPSQPGSRRRRRSGQNACSCWPWFRRRTPHRFSRAKKIDLPCIEILNADEANVEYICDQPGPDIPELDVSNELPPELRCSVDLKGTSIVYQAKTVAWLQDVQERLFPRLFDLTSVAEKFQSGMRRRVPHSFILDLVAWAKMADESDADPKSSPPLVKVPFAPRETSWKLLKMLGVNRAKSGETSWLPRSSFSIYSDQVSVQTEIPYKAGDPLHVRANVPEMQLMIHGIVDTPVVTADALNVYYQIKFPKVWNHVHKTRLECVLSNAEVTYMPDLLRCIDDLGTDIDAQVRKPEDVRYFVPTGLSISIKAEKGFSCRLAASRGNAWQDIYKGLSDDFGMVVLKGKTATLSVDLNAGLEYEPFIIPVEWGLYIPKPSVFLALPCPQSSDDPFLDADYDETRDERTVPNPDGSEHLNFVQRIRQLIDGANAAAAYGGRQRGSKVKRRQSLGPREDEQVLIRIIEVGGEVQLQGQLTTHDKCYADSVNKNRVLIRLSGVAFDLNPHHMQHLLNIITNCSALTNHTLTAAEKDRIDAKRRALAHDIVSEGRVPTFEECVLLGTEGGISLSASAYNAGGVATAMDDETTIDLEIQGGCLMLHNLPNALCSFTAHSNAVCTIDVGDASFALNGSYKEMVSRFAPKSNDYPIRIYPGHVREIRSDIFRRAQSRPRKGHSLENYPQVVLSELLVSRQGLFNKRLGAYYTEMEVTIGKIDGCIPETTLSAISGFAKSISIRPAYDEAPVVEALVGVQTIQVRIGRTDVLFLCGSKTRTDGMDDQPSVSRQSSSGMRRSSSDRGSTRRRESSVPASVHGIAQFRMRDGMRMCMSNFATSDSLSRTGVTIPDLSLQLFTPWGGSLTPWIDESTLRAQVSHSSAIKAWRQVGVQQGRAVMHRAGVFENFVMRLIWESHPSLWSETVHILQRSRLEGADKFARRITHLWEKADKEQVEDDPPSVLESYNSKWWHFLDSAGRRERSSVFHRSTPVDNSTLRRDVVSVFVLSNMTLSIGPEALELANHVASNIRTATEAVNRSAREDAGDLVEIWRDLNSQSALSDDHDLLRGEHRTPRIHGITVSCNLFVAGASLYLICPYLGEDVMDHTRGAPVIVRDEHVSACFPDGMQLSYRWRSQRGATGVPSPVEDYSAGPSSPSYSLSLRQSAFAVVPLIVISSSMMEMATVSNIQGRIADAVTYKRKRRVGGDLAEETHRGNHRTVDISVASCMLGKPGSGLQAYSELGRVLSIYGLMLRALSLDLNATFRWQQERRDTKCEAVFAVPFSVLSQLSPAQIQVVCFGRQVLLLKSSRYIPQGSPDDFIHSFTASEELEANLVSIARIAEGQPENRVHFGKESLATFSMAVRARLDEFSVSLCDREALAIRRLVSEAQFEMAADSGFGPQDPPLARISVGSVTISLRDYVAESGLLAVSSVASYIRFAASFIPMLTYEVMDDGVNEFEGSASDRRRRSSGRDEESMEAIAPDSILPFDNAEGTPKRSRYSVRNPTRFKLRRRGPQDGPPSPSWAPRARRRTGEDASVGQGRSTTSSDRVHPEETNEVTGQRPTTPLMKRRSGRPNFNLSTGGRRTDKREKKSLDEQPPKPCASQDLTRMYQDSVNESTSLRHTLQMYQAPRPRESSSERRRERRRADLGATYDSPPRSPSASAGVGRPETVKPSRRRETRARKTPDMLSRANSGDAAGLRREPSIRTKLQMSTALAATIVCSVNDVRVEYIRRASEDAAGFEYDPLDESADLAIAVKKIRGSAVLTPKALCQSIVVTVDDASLRSGNSPSCILESSVHSIVTMVSISSGVLATSPKRIVSSSKISDFDVTLRAQDVQSVVAFSEKFKKDMASLALSSVSTRKSLSAMARATKLENLRKPAVSLPSFATVAVDVAFDNVCTSLLGFHPADKDMKISYEVSSVCGSLVAMEDCSVTLSLGCLVYGHGLVLSSPSWKAKERFDFPALDARGVQWIDSTGLPTEVKVTAGNLVSTTSFQGLRHVLFAVSGLLAFQNRAATDGEQSDSSADIVSPRGRIQETRMGRRSLFSPSHAAKQNPVHQSRTWLAWEQMKIVRVEYALRPMSIRLVSGGVMAAFDTESVSGIIEWNRLVHSGNQLRAVFRLQQFRITYSTVDGTEASLASDELRAERSSFLVLVKDVRLDVLKSQLGLTHTFIFRVNVASVNGQLRPWRLLSDATVWANEQDVVKEFQAVNTDATARNRAHESTARSRTSPRASSDSFSSENSEHRIVFAGVDVDAVRVAVPLLDHENLDTHRLRVTANNVRFQMRYADDNVHPAVTNLAQLRSTFIGVHWEDAAFLSANHAQVMFAAKSPTEGKKAHFGALRGSCSTKSWVVCPRKDVILAFIEAQSSPDNVVPVSVSNPMPRTGSNHSREELAPTVGQEKRRQLFQSIEFMVLPSQGYFRGLDPVDVFSAQNTGHRDPLAGGTEGELSIPTFSVAWLRRPAFGFDLIDVDFSMKSDEFPDGILRRTGNIFSELFGAVATSSENGPPSSEKADESRGATPREISRDWSALIRFGESRYVAHENVTEKLRARFEFYAGKQAGFLASVAANVHGPDAGRETATVVTGVAPILSLEIKPALPNAQTQCLKLGFVRVLQGYAPGLTPHTFAHISEVHAEMDVMTALLVREWLKREQQFKVAASDDFASSGVLDDPAAFGVPRNNQTVIVLGRPQDLNSVATKSRSPRKVAPAVRIILRLSQPDGKVGLLVQRIHVGVAMQKVRHSTSGYLTDVHIGLHQIEARADWESLYCSFKLKRFLFRFEGERGMNEENICGFAGIVNICEFDFKRADIDALSLKIEGIAGACRVPDCDLAVQTTVIDSSISSLTGKMIERLLHLIARLAREARRQVESLVLSGASMHDSQMSYVESGGSGAMFKSRRSRALRSGSRHSVDSHARSAHHLRSKASGRSLRSEDESGKRRGFLNATMYLSGDKLSVTMHGYQFEETNGSAQLKFISYELDYKQQAGYLQRDGGSSSSDNSRSGTSVRLLKVNFDFLELSYLGDPRSKPYSMLNVPFATLDLSVHEKAATATVDFETTFEKEIEVGTAVSHFERLRGLLHLYAESRSQVAKELESGDLPLLSSRMGDEVQQRGPFGGRIPEFRNIRVKPQLKILGELTPDLTILERLGLGKKEAIEQAIPAGLYDYVMVPVGNVVEGVTRPLL